MALLGRGGSIRRWAQLEEEGQCRHVFERYGLSLDSLLSLPLHSPPSLSLFYHLSVFKLFIQVFCHSGRRGYFRGGRKEAGS
jgi:hypothetical protein